MKDKRPLAANNEYGKDEDSTLGLMKKQETFQTDLDSYRPKIDELVDESSYMVTAGHYDSISVQKKQVLVTGIGVMYIRL